MNCEVVAVGTELLLGQIVDTNSSWIGEQLATIGINSHYQTKVGDNWARISEVLTQAINRSEAVIVTGGLGPTQDDITREVLAELMGVELVLDPVIEQRIRRMFELRGRSMPQNNLRQAMVPQGAKTIPEQPGTAPGLIAELSRAELTSPVPSGTTRDQQVVVYLVPGVPREMRTMINGTVLNDLRVRAGHTDVITSRVLRTWGESESGVAELLSDRITALDKPAERASASASVDSVSADANANANLTLAFLASGIEGIKVRITARASSESAVHELLDAETETLCELLGTIVFSVNDESMEQVTLQRLQECNQTLALAETFTGGLMASRLSQAQLAAGSAPGAAAQGSQSVDSPFAGSPFVDSPFVGGPFVGSIVLSDGGNNQVLNHAVRNNAALADLALTDAVEMASAIRQMFETDWGLAVTKTYQGTEASKGAESPKSSESPKSPESKVATIAVVSSETQNVRTIVLPNDPIQRSQWASISALDLLRQTLLG